MARRLHGSRPMRHFVIGVLLALTVAQLVQVVDQLVHQWWRRGR